MIKTNCFGPLESVFSFFSTAQNEKNSRKKIGNSKIRYLVVIGSGPCIKGSSSGMNLNFLLFPNYFKKIVKTLGFKKVNLHVNLYDVS